MYFFGFVQMLMLFLAGFYVSYSFLEEKISSLVKVKDLVTKTRIYVGFASVFIGVWSFFSPFYPRKSEISIPLGSYSFIGDLIPAILMLASGLLLARNVLNYFNLSDESTKSDERKLKVQSTLDSYGTVIGIATFIAGFLHFIDLIGGGYILI